MRDVKILLFAASLAMGCKNKADLGDPCTTDEDCDDYVCHIEPGDAEGVCDTCHHDDPGCEEDHEHDTGESMR